MIATQIVETMNATQDPGWNRCEISKGSPSATITDDKIRDTSSQFGRLRTLRINCACFLAFDSQLPLGKGHKARQTCA